MHIIIPRAMGGMVKVDQVHGRQYRVVKMFAGGGVGGLAVSRALGDFNWAPLISDEPCMSVISLPEYVCSALVGNKRTTSSAPAVGQGGGGGGGGGSVLSSLASTSTTTTSTTIAATTTAAGGGGGAPGTSGGGSGGEDNTVYLILGCDGVWDVLTDEEAASIVRREKDPLTASVRIRDHAFFEKSTDDISALVVRFAWS